MDEMMLDIRDVAFLRTLPRLTTRHPGDDSSDRKAGAENVEIKRLQRLGLLRCVIDTEHSDGTFIMAELTLTDAGRAVLAADK